MRSLNSSRFATLKIPRSHWPTSNGPPPPALPFSSTFNTQKESRISTIALNAGSTMNDKLETCLRFSLKRSWYFFLSYIAFLGLLLLVLVSGLSGDRLELSDQRTTISTSPKAVVVAKTRDENVDWVDTLRTWKRYIYTVDEENGFLTVPANKGREGMAYLTHIIENYNNLADITAFMHGASTQWHNDIGDTSSAYVLAKLRPQAIHTKGYANLRCNQAPGCPVAIRPDDPEYTAKNNVVYQNFTALYSEFFNVPLNEVPSVVGGVCCGQFAVSRERIRERSLDDYVRMREWVLSSDLPSFAIGSLLEMVWHVVFGEDAVSCPDTQQCSCSLYGSCS